MRDTVWITGVGTANPLGNDFASTAAGLLAGRSGVVALSDVPAELYPCGIAGRMVPIPVPPGFDPEQFAGLNHLEQAVLWSCAAALSDAGLWEKRCGLRVGLVLGLGAEWMRTWGEDGRAGGRRIREPQSEKPSIVDQVKATLGLTGPATVTAAACASGNFALAVGRHWVRRGWVDVAVAGGVDAAVFPMGVASFANLKVLSRRLADPAAASRPFDRGRDGFVMGEGGAMFVLEPEPTARRRGVIPYADFAGYGATSDAFHLVIPGEDPGPPARAMTLALSDAGVSVDEVGYVNAHATSTPVGDRCEARVLREVFGAAAERVPVSSTKSMTGHLISGASAFEALACLVALREQAAPPTINLDDPDPDCALCHVRNQAQERPVTVAVSNAFGFGGSNATVVFRKVA